MRVGPQQSFSDMAYTPRATRPCVLFVEDHFFFEANPPAAIFGWPTNAVPTGFAHHLGPANASLYIVVFVAGSAAASEVRERAAELFG